MSKRPKPREVPGTASTRTTSTGRTIPFPLLQCERCGDTFAGQCEYEVHAQVLDGERGDCLTREQRRALACGAGDPHPMTQDAAGVWSFPPNPPDTQAVVDELIDYARLRGAVDEAMPLPRWLRAARRLPRWVRIALFPRAWLRSRRQRGEAN